MKKLLKIAGCISLPLLIGAISGFATSISISRWYPTLHKPFFNPPNYLFGPVWTTLYILMGISFYLILNSPKNNERKKALLIFGLQLILNFCWSFIFFNFRLLGVAFVEIIILWISIALMIYSFSKINKIAGYIQIPYLLWVSFASCLNAAIWWLN